MSATFDPDCEFCAIANGRHGDTVVIWEEPAWLAFFPIKPATRGHTLIVPREHVLDLWEAPVRVAEQLTAASARMGHALRSTLEPDGLNLITSSGEAAEQSVFHLHLHVVPRWNHDAFGEIWPAESPQFPGLEDAATMIRNELKRQEEV